MGQGYGFKCEKCGKIFAVFLGIGFRFPSAYRDTVTAISKGKFGKKMKAVFEAVPHCALDGEVHLYRCDSCGGWRPAPGLDLYEPNDPEKLPVRARGNNPLPEWDTAEYVMPNELKSHYHMIREYSHRCPECRKKLRKVTGMDEMKRLPCPDCGTICDGKEILWD